MKHSKSIEDQFCLYITIAEAFLKAEMRLPKALAEETKLLARVGGLPGEIIAKLECLIDHLASQNFG